MQHDHQKPTYLAIHIIFLILGPHCIFIGNIKYFESLKSLSVLHINYSDGKMLMHMFTFWFKSNNDKALSEQHIIMQANVRNLHNHLYR